jgi:alpha-beta hydrolase superfamily lysophospholipase
MLIHGLAEHLGCYEELGCRMAAENFLAFGHDHRKFLSFSHQL